MDCQSAAWSAARNGLLINLGEVKVGKVVFVEVACGDAKRPAAEFESHLFRYLFKRTVALVAEKLRRLAIIDHQKIDITLVVEIGRDDRRGLVLAAAQAC